MAQQILGTVDLRKPGGPLAGQTRGAQQIAKLFDTIGKVEQKRRERQTLDRLSASISSGAADLESLQAAASQEPTFDEGIRGKFQQFAGSFQPDPGRIGAGIQTSIIEQAIKRSQGTGQEISKEEKQRNTDTKTIANEKSSRAAVQNARARLKKNPTLVDVPVDAEVDYASFLNKKLKRKVKGGAAFDKAFGEEAFTALMKQVEEDALTDGVTPESAKANVEAWWDRQVAAEKGDKRIEFIARDKFKKAVKAEKVEAVADTAEAITQEPSPEVSVEPSTEPFLEQIKAIQTGPGSKKEKRAAMEQVSQTRKALKRLEELRKKAGQ
jgi:hypothetical protein